MRTRLMSPQTANRVWLILLWLAPLAFLAGLILYRQHNAEVQVPFQVDRYQAIALAQEFASAKGIQVTNWEALCKTEAYNHRYFYYRIKGAAIPDVLRKIAPAAAIRVLLSEPQRKQNIEVFLAPDGRVLSYNRNFADANGVTDLDEEKAQELAQTTMSARPEAIYIDPNTRPIRSEDRGTAGTIRQYRWNWKAAETSELEGNTTIYIRGNEVIGEVSSAELETKYAENIFGKGLLPVIIAASIYVILALVVVIFGIFRFTERLRQKEVSYARLIVIAIGVLAAFGGFMFQTDVGIYDAAMNLRFGGLSALNNIFGVLTWGLLGLVLGFAYCSGEGDLRELYPGKLTSLDSLLTGRLFSRNVAQAIIHGTALSGWLLLLTQIVVATFDSRPGAGWRFVSLEPHLSLWPWLTILLSWPAFAVLSVIFTLLLPLPLLQRRLKNRRIISLLLLLIAFESSVITSIQTIRPWWLSLVPTLLSASVMLIAFFKFDILTAIIALGSSELVGNALLYWSQPAPGLHKSGVIITVAGLIALVLALYFYRRGRLYSEDEVRPHYASNLAERLSLQAEVSAAREAQIRLLPDKLPEIRRLAVAAACQPAHEVGGDFYDLFELEPGKLGIFMSEGGGRGLAAALTIAFAKGFLMPKIKNETLGDNSPTEIVRSLQTQFIKTMAQDEAMSFIYAVVDTSDNTFRYAGVGDFPRPVINTDKQKKQAEEHQIRFQVNNTTSFQITEGIQYLSEGDLIAILSDSAAQLLQDEKQREGFWKRILDRADSSYRLRDALADALHEGQRRQPDINDDLTAVVVRLKESGGAI